MHTTWALAASYFDGTSAKAHPVLAWVEGDQLHWGADGEPPHAVPMRRAVWPERQRHGQRHIQLPGGGVLAFADAADFDAWAGKAGHRCGAVVRLQQSWRLTMLALVLFVAIGAVMWRWGIPAAAAVAVRWVPHAVEAEMGGRTLAYLDDEWLQPSALGAREQAAVAQAFAAAASRAAAATGPQPEYRIHLRNGGKRLGPNAFALPGGDIVVTDALVQLLRDQPDALTGVIAHELGHVQHRHGLRLAAQAGAVGIAAGLLVGDFSALLAGAPTLLAQLDYSRGFEREADAYAKTLMRGAGIDPRVMVSFFERLAQEPDAGASTLPIAFSTHPASAERVRFFSE